MTDEEVNKIIGEFMGWECFPTHDPSPVYRNKEDGREINSAYFNFYTNDLHALVPVWEKLGRIPKMSRFGDDQYSVTFTIFKYKNYNDNVISSESGTLHQAAAHATAKAILELKETDE